MSRNLPPDYVPAELEYKQLLELEGLDESRLAIWPNYRYALTPNDLLIQLNRRPVSRRIRVMYVIGAYRFEERPLLYKLFPSLTNIYPVSYTHLTLPTICSV